MSSSLTLVIISVVASAFAQVPVGWVNSPAIPGATPYTPSPTQYQQPASVSQYSNSESFPTQAPPKPTKSIQISWSNGTESSSTRTIDRSSAYDMQSSYMSNFYSQYPYSQMYNGMNNYAIMGCGYGYYRGPSNHCMPEKWYTANNECYAPDVVVDVIVVKQTITKTETCFETETETIHKEVTKTERDLETMFFTDTEFRTKFMTEFATLTHTMTEFSTIENRFTDISTKILFNTVTDVVTDEVTETLKETVQHDVTRTETDIVTSSDVIVTTQFATKHIVNTETVISDRVSTAIYQVVNTEVETHKITATATATSTATVTTSEFATITESAIADAVAQTPPPSYEYGSSSVMNNCQHICQANPWAFSYAESKTDKTYSSAIHTKSTESCNGSDCESYVTSKAMHCSGAECSPPMSSQHTCMGSDCPPAQMLSHDGSSIYPSKMPRMEYHRAP